MGYRLGIYDTKGNMFYGTKHYGYCDNLEEMPSYKYLKSLGKVTNPDLPWGYGNINHETVLFVDELKKFIELYDKEVFMGDYITKDPDYLKIIKENEEWEYVIIDWS